MPIIVSETEILKKSYGNHIKIFSKGEEIQNIMVLRKYYCVLFNIHDEHLLPCSVLHIIYVNAVIIILIY